MAQYRNQGLPNKILSTVRNRHHGHCYFEEVFQIEVSMMYQQAVRKPAASSTKLPLVRSLVHFEAQMKKNNRSWLDCLWTSHTCTVVDSAEICSASTATSCGTSPVNSIVGGFKQRAVHVICILLGCLDKRSIDRWKPGSSAPGQQQLRLS